MFDLNKFLEDRETRAEKQYSLIEQFNTPLLSLRPNYPGENKNDFIAVDIVDIISKEIISILSDKIIYKEIIQSLEGKTYLFNIDIDSSELKKIAMEIEESHPLGRCVDIDIFNEESKLLSRTDFGFSKRKCFICDELAFVCGRSFTHSHEEIKLNIRNRYENYIKIKNKQEQYCDLLADFALKGIILEVSSSPSFGLVSPLTQGSHSDMNFFTFLNSSFAIKPFLKEMSLVGYSSLSIDTIFKKIRIIGISAEENM
ncbi:MAG: citrate lyase holo-[acyl-carrier protein] synthase, partial [Cetobacterium sp.]